MDVKDKVVVVTGAGNGMGQQVAFELVRRGARVAAVDLNEAGLQETARQSGPGAKVSIHVTNVTDTEAVGTLVQSVEEEHGRVDGVINIAGIIHRFAHFGELTEEETERIMNVNFWGTVHVSRGFLPLLKARPESFLVNMSSLSALVPFAGQTFYGASKGAVKQFSEGLYAELMDSTVRVSTIYPGNISTNLTGNSGVAMVDPKGRKVLATTPEEAGRQIVEGVCASKFRIIVGKDARLLDRLVRWAPRWATRMVAKQMKSVL